MNADRGTRGSRRVLSRRDFLALGAAGASALAFGGYAAGIAEGQVSSERLLYRGKDVLIKQSKGHPELSIDGEQILVVNTNGTYRAAGYAFDWSSTPKGLAKKIIDNQALLARGR